MLRISQYENSRSITFRLAGELAGPWVIELERAWHAVVAGMQGKTILVDLTEVTFIDSAGKNLMTQMHTRGTEFLAVGCLNRFMVEEITRTREGSGDPPTVRFYAQIA